MFIKLTPDYNKEGTDRSPGSLTYEIINFKLFSNEINNFLISLVGTLAPYIIEYKSWHPGTIFIIIYGRVSTDVFVLFSITTTSIVITLILSTSAASPPSTL